MSFEQQFIVRHEPLNDSGSDDADTMVEKEFSSAGQFWTTVDIINQKEIEYEIETPDGYEIPRGKDITGEDNATDCDNTNQGISGTKRDEKDRAEDKTPQEQRTNGKSMKQEFRVTINAAGNAAAEEFFNTMRKVSEKAEYEHGINVDVERIETTETDFDVEFGRAGQ